MSEKLSIFHKVCKDDVKLTDLISLEITPTYNTLFLVSGGGKDMPEINYLFYERDDEERSI
jgi:hypothetical protein